MTAARRVRPAGWWAGRLRRAGGPLRWPRFG